MCIRDRGGRPRAFELVEADASGRMCVRHAPSDRIVELYGVERDGLIFVAGTVRSVAAGVGAS